MADAPNDHYATLGVEEQATEQEIRKAFSRRMREVHPDRGGDPEQAAAVNAAFEVLGSAETRAEYDRDRAGAREGTPHATAPGPAASHDAQGHSQAQGHTAPHTAAGPAPRAGGAAASSADEVMDGGERLRLGAVTIGAVLLAVSGWLLGNLWITGPARELSSDRFELGYLFATGVLTWVGYLVGAVTLASPTHGARLASILAVGTVLSGYGQWARAHDGAGSWIGDLFSDNTWQFWAWTLVTFLLALGIRRVAVPALGHAYVGDRPARGPAKPRQSRSQANAQQVEDFDLFLRHHRGAGHRLVLTMEPFQRGSLSAPVTVQCTDLSTGKQRLVQMFTMRGYDDQRQWVIALDHRDLEVDRCPAANLIAWNKAQG
ncbi:MAG: J domain-containing protein [Microbacteriaceae bacterium]